MNWGIEMLIRLSWHFLFVYLGFFSLIAFAQTSNNANEEARQQLIACFGKIAGKLECPAYVYEASAEDPADRVSVGGEKQALSAWSVSSALTEYAAPRQDPEVACQLRENGTLIKCAHIRREAAPKHAINNIVNDDFVMMAPPYWSDIPRAVILTQKKFHYGGRTHDVVDEFWKDWVRYEDLTVSDQANLTQTIKSVFERSEQCAEGLGCRRYNLLRLPDGNGAVAVCNHPKIGENIGPPERGSCIAQIAIVDENIYAIAVVKALPKGTGGCKCILCCMLDMAHSIDFLSTAKEEEALKQFRKFTLAATRKLIQTLKSPPWSISLLQYEDGLDEFKGISGRRKSNLIDGFEDFYLYVRPVARVTNLQSSESAVNVSRGNAKAAYEYDFEHLAANTKLGTSIKYVIHLELYVSKYNTEDNKYWIRPSKEQEQRYFEFISSATSEAIKNACKESGYHWKMDHKMKNYCSDQ